MPKATVLCVDDDANHLIECQILLRNHGYHALITTSERQSLALLATLPIDAVILHVQGPAANWELLATKMKNLKPQIPVLLLAPGARLPDRSRSADTVLSETESTDKLLGALRGLLSSRSPFFAAWFSDWKRRSAA
jgi:DNA-binding NtrC family response regulator